MTRLNAILSTAAVVSTAQAAKQRTFMGKAKRAISENKVAAGTIGSYLAAEGLTKAATGSTWTGYAAHVVGRATGFGGSGYHSAEELCKIENNPPKDDGDSKSTEEPSELSCFEKHRLSLGENFVVNDHMRALQRITVDIEDADAYKGKASGDKKDEYQNTACGLINAHSYPQTESEKACEVGDDFSTSFDAARIRADGLKTNMTVETSALKAQQEALMNAQACLIVVEKTHGGIDNCKGPKTLAQVEAKINLGARWASNGNIEINNKIDCSESALAAAAKTLYYADAGPASLEKKDGDKVVAKTEKDLATEAKFLETGLTCRPAA